MNKILAAVIAVILFIVIAVGVSVTAASEAYIPSDDSSKAIEVDFTNAPYDENDNIRLVRNRIKEYQQKMDNAHQKAQAARAQGCSEDHATIQEAKREWADANANYQKQIAYEQHLIQDAQRDKFIEQCRAAEEAKRKQEEEARWNAKKAQYPTATEAWLCMKSFGWNDIVCAGIMGNLMLETGGGTLNLNWQSNSSGGLGLVQWIGGRRNQIRSKYGTIPSVANQMKFVYEELNGVNGVTKQVTDSQYKAIMNASTPEDCAFAFASYYERCAVQYRAIRKTYARTAYNYFTS